MTNQEDFKKDTQELWGRIKSYKKKYRFIDETRHETPISALENQLRQYLEILWTNEESRKQKEIDSYC